MCPECTHILYDTECLVRASASDPVVASLGFRRLVGAEAEKGEGASYASVNRDTWDLFSLRRVLENRSYEGH